ncbi:MAG: hypothetical protein K2N38_05975 [Oscillospiraceae bacterium]|nr:hypothetical protein [Oscillospiraceae bacterium]
MVNFPNIVNILKLLCNIRCKDSCSYCRSMLDIHKKLKDFFGFDEFRTFDNEPLQERTVQVAVDGRSLLAVFPTSGGKSVTFHLPALMAGQTERGLTVVISPLRLWAIPFSKPTLKSLFGNQIMTTFIRTSLTRCMFRRYTRQRDANSIMFMCCLNVYGRTAENGAESCTSG